MIAKFLSGIPPFSDEVLEDYWLNLVREIAQSQLALGEKSEQVAEIVGLSDEELKARIKAAEDPSRDANEDAEIWIHNQVSVLIEKLQVEKPEFLVIERRQDLLEAMEKWAKRIYKKRCRELHISPDRYIYLLGAARVCLELRDITRSLR
jgi:hypothetical protein